MTKHTALPASLAALLLLGACTATSPSIDTESDASSSGSAMIIEDIEDTDDTESSLPSGYDMTDTSSSAPTAALPSGEARIIEMTVTDWEFSQKSITAALGEKVIVRLTGVEGSHSFTSQDLGINIPIAAGETKDIEIPTGTAGTFSFRCAVPCGPGHRDMTGSITIS